MNELVKEYGGALFELADEEGVSKEILDEVRQLGAFFGRDSEYVGFLSSPNITVSERVDAVGEALDGRTHRYVSSFVKMMTERGYARHIGECFNEYERRYDEKNNIMTVDVKSARPLTEDQKRALSEKLVAKIGKNIELSCSVDPSLIGGISVFADGKLYDGSVSAHVEKIKRALADITLN